MKGFVKDILSALTNVVEKVVVGKWTPGIRYPSRKVWWWEKSTLIKYVSSVERRFLHPVLIIPPLMVKPDIFDLRAGHSFVEFISKHGFDVYLVDFGIPGREDRVINVDDYVIEFIPNAVKKALEISRAPSLFLIGWSMGGIMSLIYSSIFEKDSYVRGLVIIASPVDYSKMFPFNILATLTKYPLLKATDILGNIPPFFTKTGFKLLSPLGAMRRRLELITHLHDREWLSAYETIEDWIEGFIPYPGEAFKKFVNDFIIEDKLRKKELYIKGRRVDLSKIRCPILVFAGTKDKVAHYASVTPIVDLVSSKEKKLIKVPLGHLGIVAGKSAPQLVWKVTVEWLERMSKPLKNERKKGGK